MTVTVCGRDRANPWNEAEVIHGQDQHERRTEEPKGPLDEAFTKNISKEIIKTLDQPFSKVLHTRRNECHFFGGGSAEKHDEAGSDPDHDHGVGDPREKGALKR